MPTGNAGRALRILVASGDEFESEQILQVLSKQGDIEVVGVAQNGEEASQMAVQLDPDIALLDAELAELDGLAAAEAIGLAAPQVATVLMTEENPEGLWREAMRAGARDILGKPLVPARLAETVRDIQRAREKRNTPQFRALVDPELMPRMIALAGAKGGVGKTTIATNMSVALAQRYPGETVLVDVYSQFGDVALVLNLRPKRSMVDMEPLTGEIDEELVEAHLTPHESGLKVLVSANDPAGLAAVSVGCFAAVLKNLKRRYRFIVLDVPPVLYDTSLFALSHATAVLLVANLFDLTTLNDTRRLYHLLVRDYVSKERIHVILNRVARHNRLQVKEIARAFGREATITIPNAAGLVVNSINEGVPFVMRHPDAPISRTIRELAEQVIRIGTNGARPPGASAPGQLKWVAK